MSSPTEDVTTAADAWFASRGWSPFPFQRQVWQAYLAGRSGLVHAATGTGKTQAAWWGPVLEWLVENGRQPTADGRPDTPAGTRTPQPLRCSKAHDVARHDQLRSRGIASRGTIRYPDAGLIRVNLE